MGQLLAEEAGLASAEEYSEAAAAFTIALATASKRGYGELAREIKRRAGARIEAIGAGADPKGADAAEEAVLEQPEIAIDDLLTWREAEVLRTLATAYNEFASRPNVIPCVRADYLCALLKGKVPKTAVRAALRRLQDLDLVYQRQFSTTIHYQPSDVAFEAVGLKRTSPRYLASWQKETTAAEALADLVETAAYLTHEGESARARIEALVILFGTDPDTVIGLVDAEVATLVLKEREREERYEAERLRRAVVDARDQLLPREVEVLSQIVADYNRSVLSYNADLENHGDELIPGTGTRFRETIIRPTIRTIELQHQLKGRLSKTAVKRALTSLRDLDLVRYELDVIMGAGYWMPTRKAFDSLSVARAEFTQYEG
jgi:hypothetical protein